MGIFMKIIYYSHRLYDLNPRAKDSGSTMKDESIKIGQNSDDNECKAIKALSQFTTHFTALLDKRNLKVVSKYPKR